MRIGISVWNNRIAPVFDTSQTLLVVDGLAGQEASRHEQWIGHSNPVDRAALLGELHLDVLLCGAVSRPLAELLSANGLRVIPFLAGDVNEVLAAYWKQDLDQDCFRMPGCCGRQHRRGRRGSRHGRGRQRSHP